MLIRMEISPMQTNSPTVNDGEHGYFLSMVLYRDIGYSTVEKWDKLQVSCNC